MFQRSEKSRLGRTPATQIEENAIFLRATASTTQGPFYPKRTPSDIDNDLVIIRDSTTPAAGNVTHLCGKIMTMSGRPISGILVELWQCDSNGSYLNWKGRTRFADKHFQGYGQYTTSSDGQYVFRTIKPVPYKLWGIWRVPHIHIALSYRGRRILTTQIFVRGYADNLRDKVFRSLLPEARETVLADFEPVKRNAVEEYAANFDIILERL